MAGPPATGQLSGRPAGGGVELSGTRQRRVICGMTPAGNTRLILPGKSGNHNPFRPLNHAAAPATKRSESAQIGPPSDRLEGTESRSLSIYLVDDRLASSV